jgi:trehalose 6-phosphate synthase
MVVWEQDLNLKDCEHSNEDSLSERTLIIASNRGPFTIENCPDGLEFQRSGGGLVTALTSLARKVDACWIAAADSDADREFSQGDVQFGNDGGIHLRFVSPDPKAYDGYYNVISNPLLWFIQHSLWDFPRAPNIDHSVWQAWNNGYVRVNRIFAEAIVDEVKNSEKEPIVMLQDYHLYLAPLMIREQLKKKRATLTQFIHIPWPGPEDWIMLPQGMRTPILEGLCGLDLLGFQTREDGLNFLRTVESCLPGATVRYNRGQVFYQDRIINVRDFPISIDVKSIKEFAKGADVAEHRRFIERRYGENQLIVRVDRMEPSKNITRGFAAFDEMLNLHPEHLEKVMFLAFLVPSRMEVTEYQSYLDELMAAAGRVNAKYGTSNWEPVRVFVGENYARAIAALQVYDVLLVNSIADGMNLVAKEGPTVNRKDGVLVLSERTGARAQLEDGAIVISPLDVYATAEALHKGLTMQEDDKHQRAQRMKESIEREDIDQWLCHQLDEISRLGL